MANVNVTPMDQVTLCNMAISLTGQGKYIGDILENSSEAQCCNLHYIPTLQETLGEFPWRFATKKVALSLVWDLTITPPPLTPFPIGIKWLRAYARPSDCMKFRRIPNGMKHDSLDTMIQFEEGQTNDANGNPVQVIYTDLVNAWGEYVYLNLDPTTYPNGFRKAFYHHLAAKIAPQLTQKEELSNQLLQKYGIFRDKAMASDMQEGDRLKPRKSAAEQARGGWGNPAVWGANGVGSAGAPYQVEG